MRLPKLGKSLLASALGIAVLAGLATPAHANATDSTFELTALGGLSISAPTTSDLGEAATNAGTLTSALGAVTVTDSRGALLEDWTASVTSTAFTTGGGTANETIGNASVSYWSGAATASSGTAVFLPGQALDANKQALSASRTAFSASGIVGNNSATWNPTMVITIPAAAVVGLYSGDITHSVA